MPLLAQSFSKVCFIISKEKKEKQNNYKENKKKEKKKPPKKNKHSKFICSNYVAIEVW